MKRKYKTRVFFGENLADAMADGDRKRAKHLYEERHDGDFVEREFNTAEEKEAYLQGLADMDGWLGAYCLEDNERTPRWVKEKQ